MKKQKHSQDIAADADGGVTNPIQSSMAKSRSTRPLRVAGLALADPVISSGSSGGGTNVQIYLDAKEVTDPHSGPVAPTKVNVGDYIGLTVGVTPSTTAIKSIKWEIPDNKVAGYKWEGKEGEVTKFEDKNLTSGLVQFYWVDGGNKTVKVTVVASVNDVETTVIESATFDVYRPAITFTGGRKGTEFETRSLAPGIIFGSINGIIGFTRSGDPKDGEIGWAQVVTSTYSALKLTLQMPPALSVVPTGSTDTGLDKKFPLPEEPLKSFQDTPGISQLSPPYLFLSMSLAADLWMMYKSGKEHSIWVPLQQAHWKWSGAIKMNTDSSSWSVILADPPVGTGRLGVPINGRDTLDFPVWTQILEPVTQP